MFRRVRYRISLLVFLAVPLGAPADEDFSSIFVFGDSLSDNGNLAELALVSPDPAVQLFQFLNDLPYDRGFSNGPPAVKALANELELSLEPAHYLIYPSPVGTNFAVAGALAVPPKQSEPIDLPVQIGAFLGQFVGSAPPRDAL